MNALRGTGAGPVVALLPDALPPSLEPPAAVREPVPGELALCDAAEPPTDLDSTLEPPVPLEDRAELALPERGFVLPVERFSTEGTAVNEEPLRVDAAVSSALPELAAPPAPAPEEEPAVFEATAVGVPVVEAWM